MTVESEDADPAGRSAAQVGELLDRSRTALARGILVEALKTNPTHTGLLFQAARADAIDDRIDSAKATLRLLLSSDPGHAPARFLLLALLSQDEDLAPAETLVLELIAAYPQSAWLYAAYARLMLRSLHLVKGRELAAEALRLDPDEEEALRVTALFDLVEGKSATDEVALRRLMAEHPEDLRTLTLLTVSLQHQGRSAEALRCAQALLRLEPTDVSALRFVRELRYERHWTLIPLWPLRRWGWNASIVMWVTSVIGVRAVAHVNPGLANVFVLAMFSYAVYSWVWPPILRRLLLPR